MPDGEGRGESSGSPLHQLFELGVLTLDGIRPRTTPRWQAAMARAALTLKREGAPWRDLRLPIAMALVEIAGMLPDNELVRRVEQMALIEQNELGSLFRDDFASRLAE